MNLTAVVVNYNTPDLLFKAIASIRKFYRGLKIIVVDGSTKDFRLSNATGVDYIIPGYNVGHANGLKLGIAKCSTKYVLLMDSDIEMTKPCLELMLMKMKPGIYGTGQVVHVDDTGHNVERGIKYLHPHFCIINRESYYKHPPLRDCGAPMIDAMKSGVIVEPFDVPKHVLHKERGTRVIVQQEQTALEEKKALRDGPLKPISVSGNPARTD